MTSYSYSLDHEHWLGRFDSRTEARQAGVAHAMRETTPPETIYVGQRVEPDLRTYGHARNILDAIRRRVIEENGEEAEGFLKRLSEQQLGELDGALEQAIRGWLKKNDLMPAWVRVEAVGEYPLPAPVAKVTSGRNGEVHDIGVEDLSVM